VALRAHLSVFTLAQQRAQRANQMLERRRSRSVDNSPGAALDQMPALVVLDRLPIPTLALAADGTVLFANGAFAQMIGRTRDAVASMRYADIAVIRPDECGRAVATRDQIGTIVRLEHSDGSIVCAKVRVSEMPEAVFIALAVFEDMTEQLWVNGALHQYIAR
jgi:PAS domain-containing protein